MISNQLRATVWITAAILFAFCLTEISVYYDPLPFTAFLIRQTFRLGAGLRLAFVVVFTASFLLRDQSLKAELEVRTGKAKPLVQLSDKWKYSLSAIYVLGVLCLITANHFTLNYVAESLGLLMVLPGAPVVGDYLLPQRKPTGVTNDKIKKQNAYSFNFKGEDDCWVNVPNPPRGLFIAGSAGSGKTVSVANQIIAQSAHKQYAGIIYDFKFPTLSAEAYRHYSRSDCKIKYGVVNFDELTRSHRINPLHPDYLLSQVYAYEFANAFYCNLKPEAIRKKDFWDTSAISILAGVIWYMKNHYPDYCTFPHVINLVLGHSVHEVIALLETNYETKTIVASLSTAIRAKADNQIAGQYGSLQNELGRVNTKEIAWVMSGNDFSLNLNTAKDPTLLCIGTNPTIISGLSPVVSLVLTVAAKFLNQQDKHHSLIMLDEGPQCYIPNLSDLPATARSNKVAMVYFCQDIAQMNRSYGQEETKSIIANLNYQFYGRTASVETAEHVSKLFGKADQLMRNQNKSQSTPGGSFLDVKDGNSSEGVSESLQERQVVKPTDLLKLKQGEFYGITVETENSTFHTQLVLEDYTFPEDAPMEIPPIYPDLTESTAILCFKRIQVECDAIIKGLIPIQNTERLIRKE